MPDSELATHLCLLDLLRLHTFLPLFSEEPEAPLPPPPPPPPPPASGPGATPEPPTAQPLPPLPQGIVWASDTEEAEDGGAAERCLSALGPPKSPFWRAKIIAESSRSWDRFYQAHGEGFFLQRTYLERDFPCLRRARAQPLALLEFGCGTGASLLPLLAALPRLHATGFDLSRHAIELARGHPVALGAGAGRCLFFAGDATDGARSVAQQVALARQEEGQPSSSCGSGGGFDAVLLLFCLSAIAPELHGLVLQRAAECLRPGGLLLLRDYGAGDEAQMRFGRGAKLNAEGSVMVRRDGTLAAFLDLGAVRGHAGAAGLEDTAPPPGHGKATGGAHYLRRLYGNRATGQRLRRVFVHATFRKPVAL
jgi:methyltransferase-like protein 6